MDETVRTLRGLWALPLASVGAVVVAALTTMAEIMVLYGSSGAEVSGIILTVLLLLFAIGFTVVGLPVWALLHCLNRCTLGSGAVAGAVVTTAGAMLVCMLGFGRGAPVMLGLLGLLPGAMGGATFMWIAYRLAGEEET